VEDGVRLLFEHVNLMGGVRKVSVPRGSPFHQQVVSLANKFGLLLKVLKEFFVSRKQVHAGDIYLLTLSRLVDIELVPFEDSRNAKCFCDLGNVLLLPSKRQGRNACDHHQPLNLWRARSDLLRQPVAEGICLSVPILANGSTAMEGVRKTAQLCVWSADMPEFGTDATAKPAQSGSRSSCVLQTVASGRRLRGTREYPTFQEFVAVDGRINATVYDAKAAEIRAQQQRFYERWSRSNPVRAVVKTASWQTGGLRLEFEEPFEPRKCPKRNGENRIRTRFWDLAPQTQPSS